ncbi:MAG: hypothetical protein ACRDOE_02700 [Streptosporangiaceae bacterium]
MSRRGALRPTLSTIALRRGRRRNEGLGPVAAVPPRRQLHEVYGTEDPNGQALTRALDTQYGLDLSGDHAPLSFRGFLNSDPAVSFRGDMGPLQYFDPVAQGKAARGVRSGAASALPNSKGPVVAPTVVQALLGPGPL